MLAVFLQESHCNSDIEKRIVGGEFVPEQGFYPFMVGILHFYYGISYWCGGVVYDKRTVISAAHCFDVDGLCIENLSLVFGSRNHSIKEVGIQIRRVNKLIMHPEFDLESYNRDIELLKFRIAIPFNDLIQPIALPTTTVQGGETLVTMGWGLTLGTEDSDVSRHVKVKVIPRDLCNEWFGGYVTENMICAGYKEGGRDACYGDSGGPLVLQNPGGFFEFTGIVSWGEGCALAEQPRVYTNVIKYKRWIRDNGGKFKG